MFSMPRRILLLLAILALALTGCSDSDDDNGDPTTPTPEPEPTYLTLQFSFDDSAEQYFSAADGLAWKGTFSYDDTTGVMTYDAAAGGPFVMLHDDGPVGDGGHEPAGAVAGDHIWGAVVQFETPEAAITLTYGVIVGSSAGSDGSWVAGVDQQTVEIAAGEEGLVAAPSLAIYFSAPAAHALVQFTIDDSSSQTYTGGLAWKGSFSYDASSRILTSNGSWPGPFPMLWDDGAWNEGGHEATGATAGDSIWSVAVWVANDATRQFEYGAISGSVNGSDGSWIWGGSNGTFTVTAGASGPITAPGLVLP